MKKIINKVISLALTTAMVVTICPQMQLINVKADSKGAYCISEGRPTYSSSETGDTSDKAVDGNLSTRWQAVSDDKNEWIYVDLGKKADIDHIYLKWEAAYAKSYEIQFSDDESNWRTVYTKGKGASTVEKTEMSISYNVTKIEDGMGIIDARWTNIDNATYRVCVDNENTVAMAPDDYKFNSHGPSGGQLKISEGEHKIIVIALDKETKVEVGRGEIDIIVKEGAGNKEQDKPEADNTEQTINFDELGTSEKQARYVKILCTERKMENYGCSLFEFQVYGENGILERPADYGENLALNKKVECSGIRDEWWMYDSEGNLNPDAVKNVQATNAIDGDKKTSFTSYQGDDQWIYVDLGSKYTVGRVVIDWSADAGKIYDVDVSEDGKSWTTVHRVLNGYTEMEDNFTLYKENIRYVRVFGYTKVESGSGIGINELEVYEYIEGDSKENETIEALPAKQIIYNKTGKGSYVTNEMYNEKNKLPSFINEDNIQAPIESNSWWSSTLVKTFGNLLCVTPLKAQFSTKGLGVLAATSGWVGERKETDLGTDQNTETSIDFYVMPDGYNSSKGYDRVESYGDYSVTLGLMDNKGMQMESTLVKGSPYIFNEFKNNTTVFINSSSLTDIFDKDGKAILTEAGMEVVTDHFGFTTLDDENAKTSTKTDNNGTYYCVNLPEGTTVKAMVIGSKDTIKITFPSIGKNYMSIGHMTSKNQIEDFYKHGYAFVTDTYVGYSFDEATSKVKTTYEVTTELKREGFSNITMQSLFPHQWKVSEDAKNPYTTYTSIRGDMKAIWANEYMTIQQFNGLLPTFALPDSSMFDSTEMLEYLNAVVASKLNTTPVDDAYWEGKNIHPLAISAIMADQLGETEIKNKLLKKLKSIFVDWFNYDGGDDKCYLIYNKDWGTVYYPNSAYGANAAICDHNFTYGYFAYGAAVLAMYDEEFLQDYGDMVEILIRDYANPIEGDEDGMFCKFRSFDQYSGHAWAGGYGDNDSGNNQESASEALFSWVGMYLWGQVTQNSKYIDAAAYGFTTEMYAVLQYWFDYDETNWLEEFPFEGIGQIYGASMGYGTYFGGQPVYVYGIQWLPISEYLTNYGMNQEKCAKVYQGLEDDTAYAINIEKILRQQELDNGTAPEDCWHNPDTYVTPDNGWQHITWPFLSQTNPQRAYEKFENNVTKVQTEDRANTLWFIAAMDQLGYRTADYVVTGNIQGSVYYNEESDMYTAEVWNPTRSVQTVTVKNQMGKVAGTANIEPGALVSFEIVKDKKFSWSQVPTPTIKAISLANGTVKDNLSGEVKFDDTQMVEIECNDSNATIYYTTDGTTPTKDSPVYNDKILVSSNTTVKAMAIREGYINSSYGAAALVINGDVIQNEDNLALGKIVTASSEDKPAINAVDGNKETMWQADADDDEWIQVDLDEEVTINTVKITWEAAYAAKYRIQVSLDGEEWTTVKEENGLAGDVTTTFKATKARYVRMQGISRGTQYGYGVKEIEIYSAVQTVAPVISHSSGNYDGTQTITMTTAAKGAEIKYTLDGSMPTEDSTSYTKPISIEKSTVIKAITYRKGMIVSDVVEARILINGTMTLNKSAAYIAIGKTAELTALTAEKVTWSSNNNEIATVDSNGLVTGRSVGIAIITAKTANGLSATCEVRVTEPIHIQGIAVRPATLEMKNKTSETLSVIITPADTTDDKTITWSSSDENIAVVNDNGTVTAKNEGTVKIKAQVGNFTAECQVIVGPQATVSEMAASSKYNLAFKKKVTANPTRGEGDEANATDGSLTGSHVATTFGKEGTYYDIDLGATYDASGIDQIVSVYKGESDSYTPVKGYEILYSANGIDYTVVKQINGSQAKADWIANGMIDIQDVPGNTGAVRYVRIYYPDKYDYGIQVREIAVLSTEQKINKVEIEKCQFNGDVTVVSNNYGELTYTITDGVGQEDYRYIVYLNKNKIAELVDAGSYTVNELDTGDYTVEVVAYYDKKISNTIGRTVYVDDGSLKKYIDTARNLTLKGTAIVYDIAIDKEEGSKNPNTLVDGIISQSVDKVVETTWGSKTASVVIELDQAVDKNDIEEVLLAFKAENTMATKYTVEFSADGSSYQQVMDITNTRYKETIEHAFDKDSYSGNMVKFVRINFTDGNCTWGYQISEIALMGTEKFLPPQTTTPTPTTPAPTEKETTVSPTTPAPTEKETTVAPTTPTPTTKRPTTQKPTTKIKAPKKVTIKKATRYSLKKIKVSLKKLNGVKGYQITIYKTKKDAKKNRKVIAKKYNKSINIIVNSKKLKKLGKVYVKARAYVVDSKGIKHYGKWSKIKAVKTKK